MKIFLLCVLVFIANTVWSQGVIVTPARGNANLILPNPSGGLKRAIQDTLLLPFFDDFTSTNVFPNKKYWTDKQVYINSHFAISPPSYGVATFDNLNSKGTPYNPMSGNTHGASDSLTSSPINLKTTKLATNYTIADSIFLSFFYQAQGLGDVLDATDSLVLKFRSITGNWKTVWKTIGTKVKPFKQVLVGIKSTEYLYKGFQFRFINFTKNTGNMNQWHLDYIRMQGNRSMKDTSIEDIAINAIPIGPLKWYHSMPYSHFTSKYTDNMMDSLQLLYRNNNDVSVNVNNSFKAFNGYKNVLFNIPISSFGRNVLNKSNAIEKLPVFRIDTLTGKWPFVDLEFKIAPLAGNNTPDLYGYKRSIGNNDTFTKKVEFKNYYAYDDGTAEGGFGLDYAALPNGPGFAAIKFNISKADTLRGISVFFNRSVSDVQFKSFNLIVWQNVSEPPANNTLNDVLLKKLILNSTQYADSINGFIDFIFDSAVAIPQGKFYIGWQQNSAFILNVGYDKNYKYLFNENYHNPNVFYNLNGYWEKVSSDITGVPMIRPLFGEKIKTNNASVSSVRLNTIIIYPNPSNGSGFLNIENKEEVISIQVIDMNGRKIIELNDNNIQTINVSNLNCGLYNIICKDEKGNFYTQKYIKTQE